MAARRRSGPPPGQVALVGVPVRRGDLCQRPSAQVRRGVLEAHDARRQLGGQPDLLAEPSRHVPVAPTRLRHQVVDPCLASRCMIRLHIHATNGVRLGTGVEQREQRRLDEAHPLRPRRLGQAIGQRAAKGRRDIVDRDHPLCELAAREAEQPVRAEWSQVDLHAPLGSGEPRRGVAGHEAGDKAGMSAHPAAVGQTDDRQRVAEREDQGEQAPCRLAPLDNPVGPFVGADDARDQLRRGRDAGDAGSARPSPPSRVSPVRILQAIGSRSLQAVPSVVPGSLPRKGVACASWWPSSS